MTDINAGDIRRSLMDNHDLSNPEVIAWPSRSEYYVVGMSRDELPQVDGYSAVSDPRLNLERS